MKQISRKGFIKKLAIGGGAASIISSCVNKDISSEDSLNIITKKHHKWKMVTTWPPNFPVFGESCKLFAEMVDKMSEGRLKIKVYGGGELVPPLESFEAVSSGAAEIGSGAAYYWAGRSPATQFFATVPFGMNAQQVNSWMIAGDGLKLWRELYARFNLVPILAGNSGVQMGGWFNREINTIDDFKGLKMRMPGLGGKILEKVGSTAVLVPGSELYTSMERGIIDALEWVGPYHDYLSDFHKISKYYYAPGWHEPGTVLEMFINKRTFDQLDEQLKTIIETVSLYINSWMLAEFESKNNEYLHKIKDEGSIEMRYFSKDILRELKSHTDTVIGEICSKDPDSKKIYGSYDKFRQGINQWAEYSEKSYYLNI